MKLTDFGLCTRKLRLEYGLTLREMAAVLSISSPYLSSIELGERKLTEKIADGTMNYFSSKATPQQLSELRIACDKTINSVPVSMLKGDDRNLVAAFARRLSDGHGIPPDVMKWLEGKTPDDNNK